MNSLAGFKQGWNTFVVSVSNQSLAWHLEKFTGKSKSFFSTKTAYFMKDTAGNPVRAASDVNEWGAVNSSGELYVGFPYWIYMESTDIGDNFLQYPLGWDVYYPSTTIPGSSSLDDQSISYGDKYTTNDRGYLQLNRKYGSSGSDYFMEVRRGNVYMSDKLCIGGGYASTEETNGEFKCYVTGKSANQYVEIVKQDTSTSGGGGYTVSLDIHDYGNNNPENGSRIHFLTKHFTNGNTANNQMLGEIKFSGYNSSRFLEAGSIYLQQDGNFISSDGSTPASMIFKVGTRAESGAKTKKRLIINKEGYVGIGESNPTYKLDVQGDIKTDGDLYFSSNSAIKQDTNKLKFFTDGSERMIINENGRVGIGDFSTTVSPETPLHIKTAPSGGQILKLSTTQSESACWLELECKADSSSKQQWGIASDVHGKLQFLKRFGLGGNEKYRMAITGDGNVGIGDFSVKDPESKLTIYNDTDVESTMQLDRFGLLFQTENQSERRTGIAWSKNTTEGAHCGITAGDNYLQDLDIWAIHDRRVNICGRQANTSTPWDQPTLTCWHDKVGIKNSSPDVDLDVTGDISCNTLYVSNIIANQISCVDISATHSINGISTAGAPVTSLSDNRLKHNQNKIINALSLLEKLSPKTYFKTNKLYETNQTFALNDDNLPVDEDGNLVEHYFEAGLVAQEILEIDELKHFVHGSLPNKLSLNYNSIFSYMIAALKELNQKYNEEKSKVSLLENQMENVLKRLSSLEEN